METDSVMALLRVDDSPRTSSGSQDDATQNKKSPAQQRKISRTKRSKVACLHCRRRKVRCDVYPHGAPCTNCRLDSIDDCAPCRKKSRRFDIPAHSKSSKAQQPPQIQPQASESIKSASVTRDSPPTAPCDALANGNKYAPSFPESAQTQSTPAHQPSNGGGLEEYCALQDLFCHPTQDGTDAASPPSRLASAPGFLTCDLSEVSDEDFVYLQNKGCFKIPEKSIVDELMQTYFDFVAPHMPFVDETSFWDIYHGYYNYKAKGKALMVDQQPQISLLLFQAMIFAATTCAPVSLLKRLGYTSRSTARRDAFFRVRALYSLDVERDNLVLVQAFLLMSYWRGEVGEDKDAWHWVGLAVSLAHHLGLHRNSSAGLTQRQDAVRRRCWWSCVVRDRLLALAQHRRPRIRLTESDVPLLTLVDYNVGLRSGFGGLSAGEELGKRTAFCLFNMQLIRLVLCMESGETRLAGCSSPSSPGSSETWTRSITPAHDDHLTIGHPCLDEWRRNVPEVLQRSAYPDADESVLPSILVLRNALQIYYHKLVLSIILPRLVSSREANLTSSRDVNMARSCSLALAQLHDELVDRDCIHCIPSMNFDPNSLSAFDTTPQIMDFNAAGYHAWSSRLSSPPRAIATQNDVPGMLGDTLLDDQGQGFADLLGGAVQDGIKLPELTTDGPSIDTEDGSTSRPSTVVDFDGSLPFGLVADDKDVANAGGLHDQDSGSYDQDLLLFI